MVSPELEPLARNLYVEALKRPVHRAALHSAIEAILSFLSSPKGRTNANCGAVSTFLELDDDWEGQWRDVPQDLADIMASMAAVMTALDSDWTAHYGALPEQLLARLRGLDNHGE